MGEPALTEWGNIHLWMCVIEEIRTLDLLGNFQGMFQAVTVVIHPSFWRHSYCCVLRVCNCFLVGGWLETSRELDLVSSSAQ